LRDGIQALKGMDGGRVAVGVISTAKYLPRCTGGVQRTYPNVEMRIAVGNRSDIIAALERFELDIAVMAVRRSNSNRAGRHRRSSARDHARGSLAGEANADPAHRSGPGGVLLREPGSGPHPAARVILHPDLPIGPRMRSAATKRSSRRDGGMGTHCSRHT